MNFFETIMFEIIIHKNFLIVNVFKIKKELYSR